MFVRAARLRLCSWRTLAGLVRDFVASVRQAQRTGGFIDAQLLRGPVGLLQEGYVDTSRPSWLHRVWNEPSLSSRR